MSGGHRPSRAPAVIRPRAIGEVIGRSHRATVVIAHPTVAELHAALSVRAGGLHVEDLGSPWGTRRNGHLITGRHPLGDGDRVEFGAIAYRVRGVELHCLLPAGGVRLEAAGLSVSRGSRIVLQGANLTIEPGRFVGVLGPSGSGKSTLLKCLAGTLPFQAGTLRADDLELLGELESYRVRVGYVPQDDLVFLALTARENLGFALRLRVPDLAAAERAAAIDALLKQLNLSADADRPVADLSGGQRKRVNVAVERLSRPGVMFLDEPTAGLDPAAETRMMRRLRDLARQGVTVVCATHVLENVRLFDQVVVLSQGKIAFDAPPADLLKHFGATGYVELYEKLEGDGTVIRPPPSAPVPSAATPRTAPSGPRLGLLRETVVHMARGVRLIRRDWALLALLIGQPLVIGLLINLSQIRPARLSTIFTFAAVASVWFGLNNTARELVRDRKVYIRERMQGVTVGGYLLAKGTLFAAIGALQVAALTGMLRFANFLQEYDHRELAEWPFFGIAAALWSAYLGGMFLGLTVSTCMKTQEAAVAVLPLLVLPQLLLTGAATGLQSNGDETGSFRSVYLLIDRVNREQRTPKEWALEASSLATYTRPCVSLLQAAPSDGPPVRWQIACDVAHMVVLVAGTVLLLALLFRRRERRWLETA